ncbi:predicted protein [Nematostella vectensis]|uniref:PHD-type domain-containing protein n=1 Tax=Nematostella vectensis TaxID=45351 RepID=A7T564_NEMVE|nr:predicted protein [Nematostella vectensis]|eukprot:XP_001620999.1 hypothetical protein NEMVEDRAFT_v1g222471 [Nematostella vectensis]
MPVLALYTDRNPKYPSFIRWSILGHYDSTRECAQADEDEDPERYDNLSSQTGKQGCNCGVMSKHRRKTCTGACCIPSTVSKCSCVVEGKTCTRACRCRNCENQTVQVRTTLYSTTCTCGKGEGKGSSCVDAARKSRCPCLGKNAYCSVGCGNRSRIKPEEYKRKKGAEFLAEKGFEIKSGPWTQLESVVLLLVLELLESSKPLNPNSIADLYNFIASSKVTRELALPIGFKSFSQVTGIKTSKNLCNLCNRRTQSNMVLCPSCQQWQHRGCAKISLSDYTSNWRCVFCNN